jgi:hypothetical protein
MKECVDCGEEFSLSPGERRFFEEKGWTLPKRCKKCRDRRREEKERGGGRPRPPRRPSAPGKEEEFKPQSIVLARADFEDLLRERRITWKLGRSTVDVVLADIGDDVIQEIVERVLTQRAPAPKTGYPDEDDREEEGGVV